MEPLQVTVEDPRNLELDGLLADAPGAGIAHDPRLLAALASAYRLRAEILVARRGATVEGALPLLRLRGPLGAIFASVAYLDGGGPAGSDEARALLVRRAAGRARERGATLELRSSLEVAPPEGFATLVSNRKATLVRELPADPDAIVSGLDTKTRNQLRKALREGLSSETVPASSEALDSFEGVYARTLRDLGSPPHGLGFFREVARALDARAHVARVITAGGEVVAAALVLDDQRGGCVLPWAASDRRRDALEPNTLLYHELLAGAVARGKRRFDFGRSTIGSPQHRFKERWGARPVPLHWTTIGRPVNSREGKLGLFSEAWKRLPVRASSMLGPLVLRWIAA
jgi:FemAB-related protein (PEP-CTERM system-associated)